MPKVFTSKPQKIGEACEHIACRYLTRKGYFILERNYTKKCGEIDIIARKGNVLHFIEVKSKTSSLDYTQKIDDYRPEDNMHFWKIERIKKTIQLYLYERRVEGDWKFDLAVVYLNTESKQAKIKFMEDIIL